MADRLSRRNKNPGSKAAVGDNTPANAIIDRLMHDAHSLKLNGESMRKKLRQLTEDEHLQ